MYTSSFQAHAVASAATQSLGMPAISTIALFIGLSLFVAVIRVLGRLLGAMQQLLGSAGSAVAGLLMASGVCGVLLTAIVVVLLST